MKTDDEGHNVETETVEGAIEKGARSDALFVKRAREQRKLTQAELAEKLGLERRTIGRFEKGDELPLQTRIAIRYLLLFQDRKRRERYVKLQRIKIPKD